VALVAQVGAERSLAAHLRRCVLARVAAPVRMFSLGLGRVLSGH
jgi:hypothetical protein